MKHAPNDNLIQRVASLPSPEMDLEERQRVLAAALAAFTQAHQASKPLRWTLGLIWYRALEPASLAAISLAFTAWAATQFLVAKGLL